MTTDKNYFFLKLNPPRPSFVMDMTEEERQTMEAHKAYWAPYVENGTVLVIGPVLDPTGGFGAAVVRVGTNEEIHGLVAGDPASKLGTYEIYPMMAVTKY